MKYTLVEGDHCKDSQGLNSHHANARAVNPLYQIEDEDMPNEKLQLRKDFRLKKKHKKGHVKQLKVVIKPHSTSLYGDFIAKLRDLDVNFATEALESVLVAFFLKSKKSNLQRALIVAAKLLKTHLGVVYSDIVTKILLCQDMVFTKCIHSWSLEDLESYMKELLNNWKIAHKNEAFTSIVALVSTFLAIFYSADKKWSISIGSFSMFLFDAKNSCKGATSLVDALLKVSAYVIGGLKKFMFNGSLSGFLYSDDQLGALDTTVSTLQAQFKYVKPGNLGKFTGLDENTFDQELQLAISSGEKLVLLYDGPTKKFVMDKIRMLRQLHCDFIQTRAAGGLRVAPFAYLLAGSTGLGKSSINEILMRYILSSNGFNHQDQYIVTLNSQDKYFSTYRSYINGVIFDDFANVNKDFVEESPCDTLLKFVNNIPFYLNMAELELKGAVVAEPKVIGVTTNVNDIDSTVYSNQPSSIMRRLKVHIYAKVRPEFQKEGTIEIDPSKVQAKFGDNVLAPDIWLFDVYVVRVVATPRPPKLEDTDVHIHRDDNWHMEYVQWNGHNMKDANINELLLYIKEATAIHYKEQNALIERSKLFNGEIICKECCGAFEYCTCSNLREASGSIHSIQSVVSELEPLTINPHSEVIEDEFLTNLIYEEREIPEHGLNEQLYDGLAGERKKGLEQGLKEMLFSWIVEGKCNLDSVYSEFVANCSKELQYLLIVMRKLAEKWLQVNKKMIIEACFPIEFEGTKLGDYYSIVVREREVKSIAVVSCCVESALRIALFCATYCLHVRWGNYDEVKYLVPICGNIILSRVNFPLLITRIYYELRESFSKTRENLQQYSDSLKVTTITAVLLLWLSLKCKPETGSIMQCVQLAVIIFFPLYESFKWNMSYGAPRSLSLLYKMEKKDYVNDWTRLAPAALTLSTLYCSKGDIVDFYTEACEKWYMQPQSRLKPTVVEVAERDKKHKFDEEWFKNCSEPFLDPLPTAIRRTPTEIRAAVSENVWFIQNLNTNSKSNCFVVCSGCVLIPFHYVPKSSCTFRMTRHNRGNKGNQSFDILIEPEQCVRVKDYDLAMVWVPKTRDVRNLIDLFPTSFHESSDKRSGRVASRDLNGDLEWSDVRELNFTKHATSGMGYCFPGIFYIWNGAKEGKCLSPVISDDKDACISGLHIGGSTKCRSDGGFIAYGVTPTQGDLLDAKLQLERFSTVIPMSSSSDFGLECMGVEVLRREIKKKSCYLRMEEDNSAYFLGSSLNCNRTPKSQVRDTPIKEQVKLLFGIQENWGSPKFKGPDGHSPHQPWEVGMKKWIVDKPGLPFGLLNKSKIDYTNNLTRILFKEKDFWKGEIRVLTWDETVNGIPGKRFIDSMNFKSSIGFPFKGSKKLFSQNLGKIDGWQDKRILDIQFIEEAEKIEALYKEGKRYYPWFTSTLKDEPTLDSKDKVRIFQASSTPFQLVMRKYTLGICRFLQMNPLDSECAVGIDPCSIEWNEMFSHLKQAQTPFYDRWFAIDYKAYDTSIPSQMIMAVGSIYVDIAKLAGYTREEIAVLYSIFSELSFSVVDFNGDVLMLDGANPSGNSLTVFINSLCNSLLMRIFFYHLYPRRKFSNSVRMMSYGDDLIAAVGSLASGYTMKGYAQYLAQFGFTVTPAQKDEKLKSFSKLCEIDFLKRKFVWSTDYGAMIAPLEEASIYKRLCNYMSSETSVEVVVGANVDGALDEWSFYGKAIYLDRQRNLIKIVEEFELHRFVHRLYMTYEQRVSLWRQNNAGPAVMGKGQSMDTDQSNCDSDWSGFFGWGNIISKMGIGGPPRSHNSGSISSDDQMSINKRTNNTLQTNSLVDTISSPVAERLISQEVEIVPHSMFSKEKEEILSFIDGSSNQTVEVPSTFDDTRFVNDSSDNSLGAFLSRPVKIHSFDWTPSIQYDTVINPWALFLQNKRVVNRIANYKLFRAKMKIKIMINGNSFFYGRLMASYVPHYSFDFMTLTSGDNITNVHYSQYPHVFLDPTTSQGGEMCLPFLWHRDYVDLVGTDKDNIGHLVIRQLVSLKHTSGDVTPATRVSVTVFAWLEDVQLEAPTNSNPPFIVPQSTPGDAPFGFGSGAPNVDSNAALVIPRGCNNMLTTDTEDTSNKMTLMSKQEVSIDSRILGLDGIDQMSLQYMAARETWFTFFNWTQAAVSGDLLFNLRVTPALYRTISEVGPPAATRIAMTASCGVVLPFQYWHGTFKVRLQFVASAFHRGRVAVVYDPHSTAAVREDNTAYTQIVDMATCRDVTFTVGPNQDRSMIPYSLPGSPGADVISATTPLSNSILSNGTISIYVLNDLSLPSAISTVNNSIAVNVFTSMGEDFRVFNPSPNFSRYTIAPQSTGVDVQTNIVDIVPSAPVSGEMIIPIEATSKTSSNLTKVFSGEEIQSFRVLLKRYYPYFCVRVSPAVDINTPCITTLNHRFFPMYRGIYGIHLTSTGSSYTYVGSTLLNYLAPAFQAFRGSIRYKAIPRFGADAASSPCTVYVSTTRDKSYSLVATNYVMSSLSSIAHSGMFLGNFEDRPNGVLAVSQRVNPIVEFEVPWWERNRYSPGKLTNFRDTFGSNGIHPGTGFTAQFENRTTLTKLYDLHVSAGEDFSFYFFTGWPGMYYNPTAPAPSLVPA